MLPIDIQIVTIVLPIDIQIVTIVLPIDIQKSLLCYQ